MKPLMALCASRGIKVVEDACQAHGALYHGKQAGTMGETGCFSFYPTKNLGGWGDGGAIILNNDKLFASLKMMRDCGRKSKYEHHILGYNSRLDTMQAAVLRVKLPLLDKWNQKRIESAKLYSHLFSDVPDAKLPYTAPGLTHVYHIYAIQVNNRDDVVEYLRSRGVGCMVNYPIPLHMQVVYKGLGYSPDDFPVAQKISKRIISLPMHPFLAAAAIKYVVETVKKAI
jgi:dTDP-4-amino-4,6-dideoxygalactose transaminase